MEICSGIQYLALYFVGGGFYAYGSNSCSACCVVAEAAFLRLGLESPSDEFSPLLPTRANAGYVAVQYCAFKAVFVWEFVQVGSTNSNQLITFLAKSSTTLADCPYAKAEYEVSVVFVLLAGKCEIGVCFDRSYPLWLLGR